MTDEAAIPRLTASQLGRSALMGAILWFAAALLCGYLGPRGAFEGFNRVILYLAVIPGTVPVVPLMQRFAGLARGQILPGMAFGTGAATLLDGLALAWWPALYGGPDYVAGAGAVILWGAGVGIMLAAWMGRAR
jgi:hypothetical protein